MRRTNRTIVTVAVCGLSAGALAVSVVPAQAAPSAAGARGTAASGARAPQAARSDVSPAPRVLSTLPGKAIARPSGLAADASPEAIAKAVVTARAAQLGVRGQLRTSSVRPALGGGHTVRLQQTFGGVPVLGGEVVVDVDPAGGTRSAISETLPGAAPSTTPRVTGSAASTTIARLVAKYTKRPVSSLVVATPTLQIFDASMVGAAPAPGVTGARLVWSAEVTSRSDLGLRRLVLLDATTGKTALHIDLINEALHRDVCDNNNNPAADLSIDCSGAAVVRTEGDAPVVSPTDVNLAYDYAGATYDFYNTVLGRNSVDNAGLALKSTVRYCYPSVYGVPCPLENAFWNGSQMVYGDGFASADDVVAHELTHGVTQYNNALFYYFQSGAINESLSDIFGEFVDQTDGLGNDDPSVKWQMGEDLPASIGVIRDMADPGLYGDPDSTASANWKANATADGFDAGGVHSNSGVGNKFAYLLTDGDTFGGFTIAGIGITKAAKVIYKASQNLTSATDYRGFAAALRTSCTALQGLGTVTAADCVSVDSAIKAVKMDVVPTAVPLATPAVCPTGTVSSTRWSDAMTNPASGKWSANKVVASGGKDWPLWYYSDQDTVYGPATSPRYGTEKSPSSANLWGDDPGDIPFATDSTMTTTSAVAVPAGTTYLRFTHAFGFETNVFSPGDTTLQNFDGGVVEYSVNGGAWSDAGPLMAGAGNNGYGFNSALGQGSKIFIGAGNPLSGRSAFTWQSQGFVTSRATLSSLAGKSVKFRFRVGADDLGGDYGWFIDSVSVYSCVPLLQLSTPSSVVTGPTSLTWPGNDRTSRTTTTYRVATAPLGKALSAYGTARTAPSTRVLSVPLTKGGTTCVAVTSRDLDTNLTSSGTRCVTLPVDDRSLKASSGWKKVALSSAFSKTLRVATKKGKTLTLSAARGGHVMVLARTAKKGGTIAVYVNGKKVGTINLKASRPGAKRVEFRVSGLAGGKVVLKVVKAGTVTIDGIAVRP